LLISGLAFIVAGLAASVSLVALLFGAADPLVALMSSLDKVYSGVWLVFAAALLVAGVSLVGGALRGVRSNLVRGPTLYILGASLGVIGLFLFFAREPASAVLALVAGLVLIVVEYRSELI
jgi:hypothetical protein